VEDTRRRTGGSESPEVDRVSAHHHPDRPVSRVETRAHQRRERQRIRAELADLTGSVAEEEIDDLDEPGQAFKGPERPHSGAHHEHPGAGRGAETRHWKLPFWKRRSATRRARYADGGE
jgi:hypothetical protein